MVTKNDFQYDLWKIILISAKNFLEEYANHINVTNNV
jgi:hypothetical protein